MDRTRGRVLLDNFFRCFGGNGFRFQRGLNSRRLVRTGRFRFFVGAAIGCLGSGLLLLTFIFVGIVVIVPAGTGVAMAGAIARTRQAAAHFKRDVVVERAGVRFLISNAQFRQQLEYDVGLDLKFAGQLVDADFTHTMTPQREKLKAQ
jgi:hypothetical protein